MRCHPLFATFAAPRTPVLGPFAFTILAPDAVEEYYTAVVESTGRLAGFMGGDWPRGLTLEQNRIDLSWHAKEFELNRSFAWIARKHDGVYQGCVYIYPAFAADEALVPVWVRSTARPEVQEPALAVLVRDWLEGPDWPELTYRIVTPTDEGR